MDFGDLIGVGDDRVDQELRSLMNFKLQLLVQKPQNSKRVFRDEVNNLKLFE